MGQDRHRVFVNANGKTCRLARSADTDGGESCAAAPPGDDWAEMAEPAG